MFAIIAGVFLWCFVIIAYVLSVDLGVIATTILLSLGAVLVASYAIQSFKLSAAGFELKTRQVTAPIKLHIEIPKIDYVKALCYATIFIFVLLAIVISFLPTIEELCSYQTARFGRCNPYSDFAEKPTIRIRILFYWDALFSAIAVAILLFRWVKARKPAIK